jgi:NAD(P)-dependent dehydrogenase (short-subunit alcohol dehydrogenase family)
MELGIFNLMGSRDPEKPTAEIFAEVAEPTRLADQLGYSIAWFAEHQLGPIDVLINNAGMFPRVPFLEMTEHDWDHVLDVNLKGSCFCAQYVAKAMVAAGGRDRSSISLRRGAARLAPGRALRGEQGRHSVPDPCDGAGAGPLPHQGQCDRAGAHRYCPAALWQQRG